MKAANFVSHTAPESPMAPLSAMTRSVDVPKGR
jgi:hypothetical protein